MWHNWQFALKKTPTTRGFCILWRTAREVLSTFSFYFLFSNESYWKKKSIKKNKEVMPKGHGSNHEKKSKTFSFKRRKLRPISILERVLLIGAFRIFLNELFKKNFDVIFIKNIKSYIKNLATIFFSDKKFLKIFLKSIPLRYLLTLSY